MTPPPAAAPRSVLMIGSEALPFAKTGGLADVLGSLPAAVSRLGWDVTLVLPRYRGVEAGLFRERLGVSVGGYYSDVSLFEAPLGDGARALLVEAPGIFDREFLYGHNGDDYPDNPRRFALLTRTALEWALRQPEGPAIVHAHDWQAALAPVYLRGLYRLNPTIGGARSVLTVHNLAYQGWFDASWMPRLDLPWELYTLDQMEFWGRMNFLKGGLASADAITAVSPRYAVEIQTAEGGQGLHGILQQRADRITGILNGIDTTQWNPATDPWLPQPFSRADVSGKRAAKRAVLGHYGLPADDATLARPMIGMISRMAAQKGLDLIEQLANELAALDATFIVLGTGEPRYQDMWLTLAARHPDRFGVRVGFDEGLSHLIEAGLDLFLMPSLYEPCGLNQMYSLRYGTLPIVRRVGGLADTVHDHRPGRMTGTGFVFETYTAAALLEAIRRALATYPDTATWRALQANAMGLDLSWDRSAREYVKLYEDVITTGRP